MCGEIDTSKRDTDNNLSYSSSFHQVWNHSGKNGTRLIDMVDLSEQPPLGFCLFFREVLEGSAYYGLFQTGMDGKADIGIVAALFKNFYAFTRYYGTTKLRKGEMNRAKIHICQSFENIL